MPIQRHELKSGDARNIKIIFAALENAYIEKIIVRDPYCGTESGQISLVTFLLAIKALSSTIEQTTVHCRESSHNDIYYKSSVQLKRELEAKLEQEKLANKRCKVKVHKFIESKHTFHDRIVEFTVCDNTGQTVIHTYDLTGGLYYLMDKKYTTKIFHYQRSQ